VPFFETHRQPDQGRPTTGSKMNGKRLLGPPPSFLFPNGVAPQEPISTFTAP
jgi:hypothetical protein